MKRMLFTINSLMIFLTLFYMTRAFALEPQHFIGVKTTDSWCDFSGKVSLDNGPPENGADEIGIFVLDNDNAEILAGACVIGEILNDFYFCHVQADDYLTTEKDGANQGETLIYKFWDSSIDLELFIQSNRMSYEPYALKTEPTIPPTWDDQASFGLLNLDVSSAPQIRFVNSTVSALESSDNISITISLSHKSEKPVSIYYSISGTANGSGIDYSLSENMIEITPNHLNYMIDIQMINDNIFEIEPETIIFQLNNPVNCDIGQYSRTVITIQDDDPMPSVQFLTPTASISEDADVYSLSMVLSNPSSQPISVPYTISGSALGNGIDYDMQTDQFIIQAGKTQLTVCFQIVNNPMYESEPKNIMITLNKPDNAIINNNNTHALSIINEDPIPVLSFDTSTNEISENANTITVSVMLSNPSSQWITAHCQITGTAWGSGIDYTLKNTSFFIHPGALVHFIEIPIHDDNLYEPFNETIAIRVVEILNANEGQYLNHTITIQDNDPIPLVQFSSIHPVLRENSVSNSITVTLSNPGSIPISIPYHVSGSAKGNGVDHYLKDGILMIPEEQSIASISVVIVDDPLYEPENENIIVSLDTPTNAILGTNTICTALIEDNDTMPIVFFSHSSQTISEQVESFFLSVVLSNPSSQWITVSYSIDGTASDNGIDHHIIGSNFVISPEQSELTHEFSIINDIVYEPIDETIVFHLTKPINAILGEKAIHTTTLTDDDPMPEINFMGDSALIHENAAYHPITLVLSHPIDLTTTVHYTISGTAQSDGIDHDLINGSITIPLRQLNATIPLNLVDDTIFEPDNETIIVHIQKPQYTLLGNHNTYAIEIVDNDPKPSASFEILSQMISEQVNEAFVSVILSNPSSQRVTVPFITSGSAGNGEDYSLNHNSVFLEPEQISENIVISIVNDLMYEPDDETIQLNIVDPVNALSGEKSRYTLTIQDDDPIPTVSFKKSTQTISENAGLISITLMLSNPSSQSIIVPYTVTGTAMNNNVDHDLTDGNIIIPPGQTQKTVHLTIIDDNIYEPEQETIIVSMKSPDNAISGKNTIQTLYIQDNDPMPTANFLLDTQNISEQSNHGSVTIVLSNPSSQIITTTFSVESSAIGGGVDYQFNENTILFKPGNTIGVIEFSIIDESLYEPEVENIILSLQSGVNVLTGETNTHIINIIDDDHIPSVRFYTSTQMLSENSNTCSITIIMSNPSSHNISVLYSVDGTAHGNAVDHDLTNGTILIPSGEQIANLIFHIINDHLYEPANETIIISFTEIKNAVSGTNDTHEVTIQDDDSVPIVTFEKSSMQISEGIGIVKTNIILSNPSSLTITVPYSIDGTAEGNGIDHDLVNGSVVLSPEVSSYSLLFQIVNDQLYEPEDETIIIELNEPTNAIKGNNYIQTITIQDNDSIPEVSFSMSSQNVFENANYCSLTLVLSNPSSQIIHVYLATTGSAASEGTDYVLNENFVSIPEGNISKLVIIDITDDTIHEHANETIIVSFQSLENGIQGEINEHTATIFDDDPIPQISFSTISQNRHEKESVIVELTMSNASDTDIIVPYDVSGTANYQKDHNLHDGEITIDAYQISGEISFDILEDIVCELSETIIIDLSSNIINVVPGTYTRHTVVIDAEELPSISIDCSPKYINESDGILSIQVRSSCIADSDLNIPFTVSGTGSLLDDIHINESSVDILAGTYLASLDIDLIDDQLCENNEDIIVQLEEPNQARLGENYMCKYTIVDDDCPIVSWNENSQSILERDSFGEISLILNRMSDLNVSVFYSVSGTALTQTHHNLEDGEIIIPAGNISQSIPFVIVNNETCDENKMILLRMDSTINAGFGEITEHHIMIVDEDCPPTINWEISSQKIKESVGSITVSAILNYSISKAITVPYTVGGTAEYLENHNLDNGELVISENETSGSISFNVIDNKIINDSKSIIIKLQEVSGIIIGNQTVHQIIIEDDDEYHPPENNSDSGGGGGGCFIKILIQ